MTGLEGNGDIGEAPRIADIATAEGVGRSSVQKARTPTPETDVSRISLGTEDRIVVRLKDYMLEQNGDGH
jgi:hypothetical protein